MADGAKMGRPRKDEVRLPAAQGRGQGWRNGIKTYTAEDLEAKCTAYFGECDSKGRKYTKPGLALFLGVNSDTLTEWGKENNSEVAEVVKRAFNRMQDALEQRTDTAAIFLLKQPCYGGYTDRPDGGDGRVNISINFGKAAGKAAIEYGK